MSPTFGLYDKPQTMTDFSKFFFFKYSSILLQMCLGIFKFISKAFSMVENFKPFFVAASKRNLGSLGMQ